MTATLGGRLASATWLVERAPEQPLTVVEVADELLRTADDEAAVVALRARGLARRQMGDIGGAARDLTASVDRAVRLRLRQRQGEARMSLTLVLAESGRTADALAEADRARPLLRGADASRLLAQRALVLQRIGRHDEALACYRAALPGIRRAGDVQWEARSLGNRGPLRAYLGDHRGAVTDLERLAVLARAHDLPGELARAQQNLGFAHGLAGDVPLALKLLEESERGWAAISGDTSSVLLDRAEALLAVGLGTEAADCATQALVSLEGRGLAYDAAEARLLLARASLQAGRPAAALHAADLARLAFSRQGRPTWARLSRQVSVQARWDLGERGAALTRAARRAADECARAGWSVAAMESLFVAARAALEGGAHRLAARLLAEVAAARNRGPVEVRATAWHAEALLRLARSDVAAAQRALRRGLTVRAENAATLGSTDLRAHAAVLGEEMAALGVRLAIQSGRARDVLGWAERSRASVLHLQPVRPPGDHQLAEELGRLRAVQTRLRDEALAGHDLSGVQQQRDALEASVRDLARHARGSADAPVAWQQRTLDGDLGDRVLVELVRDGDGLHAVTLADGRAQLHELCTYQEAAAEVDALRFALARLAEPSPSGRLRDLAQSGRDVASTALDTMLFHPLRRVVHDRPVVVVPTGDLHALPWAALPSLRGRPVTVAPSARLWQRASVAPHRRRGRVALVAGPRLDHADTEIAALQGCYPGAVALTGTAATADATREVLDGAALAHVAAHGHFRSDNPQFSCLEMADGPLTVYDLERLGRAPEVLVLSACDSGLSDVKPGDELMGLAAAVMALGTRTLVASVVPVADEPTRPFMEAFHARLLAGETPAAALGTTTAETGLDGFVCLGAD